MKASASFSACFSFSMFKEVESGRGLEGRHFSTGMKDNLNLAGI